MAGSARFEVDMALNASGVAKGANDAAMAFADLEDAVEGVADESARSGGKVDSFASKLIDAARKAGKSDDDIKDSLRNMGYSAKQAEEAIEDIGDEFKEIGRDGDRAADKLEDALRDVQRQSKKTEDAVDDIGGKGFGKLKDGAQEVTQEVGQNLGEAVSSIRGDLTDLGQVGQDTLGGLAATLAGTGPAGIVGAAGLAAGAVGLGLVTAEIQEQNERVQRLKEYFAEAWQAAVEGGKTYIDTATVIGEMNDIIFNPDRADEYKKIQEDVNTLGLDRKTLLRAAAGDQEALNVVQERTNELLDENVEAVKRRDEGYEGGKPLAQLIAERAELNKTNDTWREYGDINDENRQKAADAAATTSAYLLDVVAKSDAATSAVDDFGNTLITLPDGRQIVIDAETGQATQDVNQFKTDTDGVVNALDGSQINLIVQTALRDAQNAVNNFIVTNEGRSFKLHGRVTVDSGGWDQ